MSDPSRSSRDRAPSGRSRTAASMWGSGRYESSADIVPSSARESGTPGDLGSGTERRSHSTELPPRADESMDDEEAAARRERREARRRLREQQKAEGKSTSRRSSTLPRPPSPRPQPSSSVTSSHGRVSRLSAAARITDDIHPSVYTDESAIKPASVSSRRSAYLRAVDQSERRSHRPPSSELPEPKEIRRSSTEHTSDSAHSGGKTSGLDDTHRSGRSDRHRSSRDPNETEEARRERKAARRASRIESCSAVIERTSSGDGGVARSTHSISSGDKTDKRKKRSSREEESHRKERKQSSRSKEERAERHRSTRTELSGDSERLSKEERAERRRSSRSELSGDGERLSKEERAERRQSVLAPPKEREHRTRTSEGDRSSVRSEEARKRREERRARGDVASRDEDYQKRREERLARRENERQNRSEQSRSPRRHSEPLPPDKQDRVTSRRSSADAAVEERAPLSASVSGSGKESVALPKEDAATRKTRVLSSFEKKLLADDDDDDDDDNQKDGSSGQSRHRRTGSFNSKDAQAARDRLRERMLAGNDGAVPYLTDEKMPATSPPQNQQTSGESPVSSSRPKLKDVRRRGITRVLKEQRSTTADETNGATVPSPPSSESDTEEECIPGDDQEGEDNQESSGDEDEELWTVRVSLISAVDLPLNVVPNMPLCPLLKFGLVTIPTGELDKGKPEGAEFTVESEALNQSSSILARIEKSGLTSIPRARVRCTGTKILSKRDNGTVEFHEEMRWDNVKRPMRTGLVVELCARAALAPPNLKEIPCIKQSPENNIDYTPMPPRHAGSSSSLESFQARNGGSGSGMGADAFQRARARRSQSLERTSQHEALEVDGLTKEAKSASTTPAISPSTSAADDDAAFAPLVPGAGLTGMRALWRKGRQQFEQRQTTKRKSEYDLEETSGHTASAVAGFFPGGKEAGSTVNGDERLSGPAGNGSFPGPPGEDRNAPPLEDENVALLRPKKKRKLEMTEDLRLGSLVIPLTRLPLQTAIENKEVARIEQWYQLESVSNALVSSQYTPTWRGKSVTKPPPRRSPSVQLEISFSPPQVLDESEDEMDDISASELAYLQDASDDDKEGGADMSPDKPGRPSLNRNSRSFTRRAASKSFSRRISSEMRVQEKGSASDADHSSPLRAGKKVPEDPVLEPGFVDFICVVGVNGIGDQKDDDGSKGWVNTSPECTLLEQFPPNDEFHNRHGRNVALANKVEWFCFPEGWRLWRGLEPPSPEDLDLKRFSSSMPPQVNLSVAAFDSCLNCTTSFSWFVIASNSDEYGSRNVKTYGAVIKFYAPAPKGIDQTQDDYAQTMLAGPVNPQTTKTGVSTAKRLWVPMGICLTSNLPIIGVMEAMLLRICESLASKTGGSPTAVDNERLRSIIHEDLADAIINYQKPIPGVLHCSIPFLSGERLHVTLPPPTGLPPLPHGSSITSVCRLLGADGLNVMLAALLTECKIIIHSDEVANLAMVAEVATALIYPFYWALPYIPVLPAAMLEFVEAPLSYFLGIPTSSLKLVDPQALDDVVVIDLDNSFGSTDYFEGRRANNLSKAPTPLPASVATKISKAVFRLLREEEQVEEEYGASNFPGSRSLPRLESESLAERDFRIAVAIQICGLVRGYDDCLFKVSASQPVFNRDKFLRTAPALFENQRGNLPLSASSNQRGTTPRTLSPRSKRFLSILVNCQHFHQFLDTLEDEECAFFNEVMYTFDMNDEQQDDRLLGGYGAPRSDDAAAHLSKALQKVEDKIPTYRVERQGKKKRRSETGWDGEDDMGFSDLADSHEKERHKRISDDTFPFNLLQPLCMDPKSASAHSHSKEVEDDGSIGSNYSSEGVHKMSVQFLLELEKGNWRYEKLFNFSVETQGETSIVQRREKVKLRDAIGERRYRAWKLAQEQKLASDSPSVRMSAGDFISAEGNPALDLTSLLSSMADEMTSDTSSMTQSTFSVSSQSSARASTLSPEQQRVADAKDRDVLRRCLERAYEGGQRRSNRGSSDSFIENGRDLITEAETALRNPSAQRFLVSILSQRSRLQNQKKRRSNIEDPKRRQANQSSVSRLETHSFDCLVRLCRAMLDACMEAKDYEPAYGLLTHTAGFCTVQTKDGRGVNMNDDDIAHDPGNKVIYMTARIGLHPIFAELSLWKEVLRLHLKDRENDKSAPSGAALIGTKSNSDLVEYEAAVATLYEMLGFGIPAEELARFATLVSEERGWLTTERGHSLLMLARRLGVRREQDEDEAGSAGDLDMMRTSASSQAAQHGSSALDSNRGSHLSSGAAVDADVGQLEWTDIAWCHPAAPSAVRSQYLRLESNEEKSKSEMKRLKRCAVTSLAAFGSSIVASGGLDGSVFVAHTIQFGNDEDGDQKENVVHGVHLDWGSSGSRTSAVASSLSSMDGEYGVGAVSCLAAAKGAGYRSSALSTSRRSNKDVKGSNDEDFLSAMEGCRVVAGTTAGDLRVWSVKDVYAATVLAKKGSEKDTTNPAAQNRITHGGSGVSSTFVANAGRRGGIVGSITDIAAGSAFSRLKFSLRGRALSGHRGGVSCIDVPSHIYRPDALVTGGADGFIKLWSLRQPMAGRRANGEVLPGGKTPMFNTSMVGSKTTDPMMAQGRANRSGDALSILSGHTGRVLCVKTAWHGDRLLSGGADRTLRIWDLAGSGGKCLHAMNGHLGWVTHAHYWGPHTIVTASTDRSIALWDPRVRKSPLFILRHHHSPVSDLLVGSRTDPLMVSAAGDGTVATWDFRSLSGSNNNAGAQASSEPSSPGKAAEEERHTTAIRTPIATMNDCTEGKGVRQSGPVLLSRGVAQRNTFLSVGVDAVVKEWEIASGRLVNQQATGHCDTISSFATFSDAQNALGTSSAESSGEGSSTHGGMITSSWDGTLRMRKFIRK